MIIFLFLTLLVLAIITGNFVMTRMDLSWVLFTYFMYASFFATYCVIKYSNYVNYILYVAFTAILAATFFLYRFPFSPVKSTNFLIWFMFVLTMLTFGGLINSLYQQMKIADSEALMGEKGPDGQIGDNGAVLDSDMNSCANQLGARVENAMRNHKDLYSILYDPKQNYFNNLYLKRRLARICRSKQYSAMKQKYGRHYEAIEFMNGHLDSWVSIILGYHYGLDFLEDNFSTAHHWKHELLSKDPRRNEPESPFVAIAADEVWNWS